MSATIPTTSGAAYTVRPVKAWTKEGASSVAAHCSPYGEGWTLTVQGWRVYGPDDAALFPARLPFATEAEAQAEADRRNAPPSGYRVRVVDHATKAEATTEHATLEAVSALLGLPLASVTPDRFGFALVFNAECSASVVTIGGLTDQAGALA